jgi:hypothetical protein
VDHGYMVSEKQGNGVHSILPMDAASVGVICPCRRSNRWAAPTPPSQSMTSWAGYPWNRHSCPTYIGYLPFSHTIGLLIFA